ncbi:hypothetical protein BG844_03970 [Couchioplanes caeruleus subsp. caeruleus]|uniref:PilZ domain-containing protein n=1 Tax=Couchioplanes caeruleus subsp. caeruleus TaxID=56427 RepID=A0A1K0H1D1_9ACTN|nr:hypothetical protein BG844_03970 [Couchioplanes caeruleus subsp. caeruleus]
MGSLINPEVQGTEWETRVDDLEDDILLMPSPAPELEVGTPAVGAQIAIAWNRPPHRYRVRTEMVGTIGERWRLRILGEPEPVTRRTFFRGGGGEAALLRHEEDTQWQVASVHDISEAALRCAVDELQFVEGDPIHARVTLGDGHFEVSGTVLLTREADKPTEETAEVVILYTLSESQAQQVRRYLLEWQLAERRRASADDD